VRAERLGANFESRRVLMRKTPVFPKSVQESGMDQSNTRFRLRLGASGLHGRPLRHEQPDRVPDAVPHLDTGCENMLRGFPLGRTAGPGRQAVRLPSGRGSAGEGRKFRHGCAWFLRWAACAGCARPGRMRLAGRGVAAGVCLESFDARRSSGGLRRMRARSCSR
jgi:hypothetical protein